MTIGNVAATANMEALEDLYQRWRQNAQSVDASPLLEQRLETMLVAAREAIQRLLGRQGVRVLLGWVRHGRPPQRWRQLDEGNLNAR
jgi:hypothetical protein